MSRIEMQLSKNIQMTWIPPHQAEALSQLSPLINENEIKTERP